MDHIYETQHRIYWEAVSYTHLDVYKRQGQQMPQTQAGYSMPQGNPANVAPVAGNYSGDGFTNIPESMPPQQLPFP